MVAISIGVANPGSGINPILNYSTVIFKSLIDSPKSAAIGSLIVIGISLLSATVSLIFIRHVRRRALLCFGMVGMLCGHVFYILIDLFWKNRQ